ncbi:MAG: hypothetical protein DRI56_10905 [Chloroflexota bacterium]|nr:MAG: hypothetical protein DRI56_10905 [Chloroflexota bacterium]
MESRADRGAAFNSGFLLLLSGTLQEKCIHFQGGEASLFEFFMHTHDIGDFDISLKEISKIEGHASLDIKIRKNRIEDLKFSITEWKRFYTQAIRGKPVTAVPQMVDRICGTCSNAHLLCCIEAIEKGLNIMPSSQTMLLRRLLYYGLIIRDHALHLYIFALPDVYGKSSILDFDENDPMQHELLHDTFAVKEVGNRLSIVVGGRAVHAPYPAVGGFLKLPALEDVKALKPKLLEIRPKILKLIKIFAEMPFELALKAPLTFSGLVSEDFSFLEGLIQTSAGDVVEEKDLGQHLDAVIIPYSHARGFKFDGSLLMVGALARLHVSKFKLHPNTLKSIRDYLGIFPSNNIYHNNLAQAIEILHAIDASMELIDKLEAVKPERPAPIKPRKSTGIGVIEAPRGTLYYRLDITSEGKIKEGEIIVPTGQNQIAMERGIYELVENLLEKGTHREEIVYEVEKLIRAFDPCMSCAAHFLRVNWQ